MAEQVVFSVLVLKIAERELESVARELTQLLHRKGPTVPGLIEGTLLRGEVKTELWVITQWASRHAWAVARWDEDIARTLTDIVENRAVSSKIRVFDSIANVGHS
jgi:heme-degrading monooxygenase HmoA